MSCLTTESNQQFKFGGELNMIQFRLKRFIATYDKKSNFMGLIVTMMDFNRLTHVCPQATFTNIFIAVVIYFRREVFHSNWKTRNSLNTLIRNSK